MSRRNGAGLPSIGAGSRFPRTRASSNGEGSLEDDAEPIAEPPQAPPADWRVRRDEQSAAVGRLMTAAAGLAQTIAATEELIQRRAEIAAPRASRLVHARAERGRPAIVSLAEAARRTGRHPEVLRRWCMDGRIPAIRVGRTWAVTPETLATLMEHSARSRPRLPTPGSA